MRPLGWKKDEMHPKLKRMGGRACTSGKKLKRPDMPGGPRQKPQGSTTRGGREGGRSTGQKQRPRGQKRKSPKNGSNRLFSIMGGRKEKKDVKVI